MSNPASLSAAQGSFSRGRCGVCTVSVAASDSAGPGLRRDTQGTSWTSMALAIRQLCDASGGERHPNSVSPPPTHIQQRRREAETRALQKVAAPRARQREESQPRSPSFVHTQLLLLGSFRGSASLFRAREYSLSARDAARPATAEAVAAADSH